MLFLFCTCVCCEINLQCTVPNLDLKNVQLIVFLELLHLLLFVFNVFSSTVSVLASITLNLCDIFRAAVVKALMAEPVAVPAMSESTISVLPGTTAGGVMATSSLESSTISSMHASAVVDHGDITLSMTDSLENVSGGREKVKER